MFASLGEDRTIRLCQVKDMTAKDVKYLIAGFVMLGSTWKG